MTDAWVGYRQMRRHMRHVTVDHSKHYVDGLAHTNTIEGFWALLKRAWYGTHHHYTDKHSIAYVVESCYKYNARNRQGTSLRDSYRRRSQYEPPLLRRLLSPSCRNGRLPVWI